MDDENVVPYAYDYLSYPYYAHPQPYESAAYPTWPARKRAGSPSLSDAGNYGGHSVVATPSDDEETPVAEPSQPMKRTEGSFPTYSYLVKVIPPANKRRATVHEMYDVETLFESRDALMAQLKRSFKDKVRPTVDFQIGYFEGRGSAKRWISSDRDLTKMYSLFEPGRTITLWCDGVDENEKENKPPVKKKRTEGSSDKSKSDSSEKAGGGSKREVAEEELKGIVEHKDLALPQVKLWGKMIQAGQCDSYDTPPDIQLIRGCPVPAKPKKESMVDIIAGAATAVVKAFQQGSPAAGSTPTSAGKLQLCVSPYVRAHTPPHTHTHHHTHARTHTTHTHIPQQVLCCA